MGCDRALWGVGVAATALRHPRSCGKSRDGGVATLRSRPGKPNQRKGQNEKFMNSPIFVNSGVFPWENKHDSY